MARGQFSGHTVRPALIDAQVGDRGCTTGASPSTSSARRTLGDRNPVHRDLSLLAAWFRLTYTVVLGAALGFLYAAVWLASSPDAFGDAHDDGILLALQTFDFTWVAGLAAFGAHLMLLGLLMLKARGPRWIAWLLMAAGAAYVLDTVAHLVLADYEASADLFLAIVALPSLIGEMSFAVWLLLVATGRRATPAAPVERRTDSVRELA